MQLRAPHIWNGNGSLLKDHAVGIAGDRITYLCPIADAPHDSEVIDLPHTTLLPGFVNAHCHMDLSHLRGRAPFQGSFTDWIRSIVSMRELLTENDVLRATRELQQSGVTTLFDHVGAFSELTYIMETPFRKRLFMEVIGVTPEGATKCLELQRGRAEIANRAGIEATPSPHATYSLSVETFKAIVNSPSPRPSPEGEGGLSIHCAESTEEWEMFTAGRGKLWEFVKSKVTPPLSIRGGRGELPSEPHCRNPSRPPLILRGGGYHSPIQYLEKNNLLPHSPWLAVHCNTLSDDDIVLLKKSQATVVHCPRSHRFFNHPPFPLEKLRAIGVPIAIGTDSLASCPNFDFLEELRTFREEFPALTTNKLLQLATCTSQAGGTGWGPHFRQQPSPATHMSPCSNAGDADKWGDPVTGPACRMHMSAPFAEGFADIIGLPTQNDLLNGPITFSMIGGRRVI